MMVLKNRRPFLVIALCKVMTFLAIVSSPLTRTDVVHLAFFLNSDFSHKKYNFSRVSLTAG